MLELSHNHLKITTNPVNLRKMKKQQQQKQLNRRYNIVFFIKLKA